MKKQMEKPFEYLRRKDGSTYSSETIRNWYKARAYVLDKLKDVTIGPTSKEHLHVIVTSDTPLMLSVVRQIALVSHFGNFTESPAQNRTVISLVSKNRQILEELKKEEYLCNLINLCKYTLFEADPVNSDSFTDIELQILENIPTDNEGLIVTMSEEEVNAFVDSKSPDEVFSIDTRKAVLANNLPAENIFDARRYKLALDVFQHSLLKGPISPLVDATKWETDLIRVKNGLSNINTTDCFGLRLPFCKEENNEALSNSEHARWVVEKLIMGFRPMNQKERIQDERFFGKEKSQYRNRLKKNPSDPVHVDLLSFAELRRINPDDLKYDSFLMLAIPAILKRTK